MYGNGNHHSNETTRTTLREYAKRAGKNEQRARSRNNTGMARANSSSAVVDGRSRARMVRKDARPSRRAKGRTRGCGKEGCAYNAPHNGKCGAHEVQKHTTPGVERCRSKIRHFLGVWTIHCGECEQRFWGLGCNMAIARHLRHVFNGDCSEVTKANWKGAY